jgi:hypothetical protein
LKELIFIARHQFFVLAGHAAHHAPNRAHLPIRVPGNQGRSIGNELLKRTLKDTQK